MCHALRAALVALPLCACASGPPGPCSSCPDVAGLYTLTRTVQDATGCSEPEASDEVQVIVAQNGARLSFDYDGAVLKGSLSEDDAIEALATDWADGVQELWDLTGEFAADGQSLSAQVVEIRAQGDSGGSCQVRAALQGAR